MQGLAPGIIQFSSRRYATLDPFRHSPNVTTAGGAGDNLTGSNLASAPGVGIATIGKSSGKWYWETLVNSSTSDNYGKVGITNVLMVPGSNVPVGLGAGGTAGQGTVGYFGTFSPVIARYNLIGRVPQIAFVAGTGGMIINGDVLSTALDCAASEIKFYRNGTLACTVALTPVGSTWYPAFASTSAPTSVTFNFGQNAWSPNSAVGSTRNALFAAGYNQGLY
jgi:hypothetical protein